MIRDKHAPAILLVAVLGTFLTTAGIQQDRSKEEVDPKVMATFAKVVETYKKLDALHAKTEYVLASQTAGKLEAEKESSELRVQRPNKLRLDVTTTKSGVTVRELIVSDGVTLWKWTDKTNTYTKSPAPKDLKGLTDLPDIGSSMDVGLLTGKNISDGRGNNQPLHLDPPARIGGVEVLVIKQWVHVPRNPNQTRGFPGPMTLMTKYLIGRKDYLFRNWMIQWSGVNMENKSYSITTEVRHPFINPSPRFTKKDFTFVPPPHATLKDTE